MPYITQDRRVEFIEESLLQDFPHAKTAGELNFLLSAIAIDFLGETPNYQKYNDAIGALEGAKLELYRRSVAPYEDTKIVANGDLPYPNKLPVGLDTQFEEALKENLQS